MGRSPSSDESGLKKGPWTPEEDENSSNISKNMAMVAGEPSQDLLSCRLRWTNYLRPDIKRGKWSAIATHLPGRTDNEIKNFWNTHLKKKLIQMGFDPMTHRPRTDIFSSLPHLIALANLKELIENPSSWEEQAVRLQAEAAQMARLNQLCLQQYLLQPSSIIPNFLNNNNNNNNNINSDMAANNFNLLSHLEMAAPPIAGEFIQEAPVVAGFSHLPDLLQAPMVQGSDQFGGLESSPGCSSGWMRTSPPSAAAPVTEAAIGKTVVEDCSYGGSQMCRFFSTIGCVFRVLGRETRSCR
ncbi:hypothetical protein DH2020_047803 [Rehmannia glutinosa]|uniref:R2R3-MYB protein n=1 Tax=Rehmannia glutinosa TaxID=99300 RepID=A0ABR0U7D4_REHGL